MACSFYESNHTTPLYYCNKWNNSNFTQRKILLDFMKEFHYRVHSVEPDLLDGVINYDCPYWNASAALGCASTASRYGWI